MRKPLCPEKIHIRFVSPDSPMGANPLHQVRQCRLWAGHRGKHRFKHNMADLGGNVVTSEIFWPVEMSARIKKYAKG